jgi:hypothetical protein
MEVLSEDFHNRFLFMLIINELLKNIDKARGCSLTDFPYFIIAKLKVHLQELVIDSVWLK